MTGPGTLPFDMIRGGKAGRLTADVEFRSPIIGWHKTLQADIRGDWVDFTLHSDGKLFIRMDTEWDFGSGAIDTPAVVRASLAHDMFCHLTDRGRIPWECREQADDYYRDLLRAYGVNWARANYHWLAVRTYSKTVAYWHRKPYEP